MKHTKGEWEWNGVAVVTERVEICIPTACDQKVGGEWFFGEQSTANARLIASSPDLLDALEMFVNTSSVQKNYPDYCAYAEKIIAKARGQS